jgi:trehalose 6-phosphate phosphatase
LLRPLLANLDPVLRQARAARGVLLALDFDGTLAPIVSSPEDAGLPPATAQRLSALSSREGFDLAVLSGRALSDLRLRVGLPCTLAGNHGLEIEGPDVSFVHPEAVARRALLDRACAELDAALARIEGAWVERKGLSATVHYRNVVPERHACVRVAVKDVMSRHDGSLVVLPARRAWEIRPSIEWDKGDALQFLLSHRGGESPLVICAGDDQGDEPLFEAVPDAVSIRVGDGAVTSARYSVATPAELAVFFGALAR